MLALGLVLPQRLRSGDLDVEDIRLGLSAQPSAHRPAVRRLIEKSVALLLPC